MGLTIALTLAILIVGYAQKSVGEPSMAQKDDDQAKARQEIAKSVAGGLVLDANHRKGTGLGTFQRSFSAGVVMTFKNAGETIHISIFDFGTADRAENAFLMPRSMGD